MSLTSTVSLQAPSTAEAAPAKLPKRAALVTSTRAPEGPRVRPAATAPRRRATAV